jgi:hypothetical protein
MPKDLRSYLDEVADVRLDVRREVDPLTNVFGCAPGQVVPTLAQALQRIGGGEIKVVPVQEIVKFGRGGS